MVKSKQKSTTHGNVEIDAIIAHSAKQSTRKKVIFSIAILVLLCVGAIIGYWFITNKDRTVVPQYETTTIQRGNLKSSVASTGTVNALNTVEVGAEISGQIQELLVDFNDPVKKDQLLAVLDPEQQQSTVAEAKAKVLSARAGQAEAKAVLLEANQNKDRVQALSLKGLSSSKELESATATAARAKASLNSAKANTALSQATYESAVSKLSKTEIRSPIDGMVLSREVEVGQSLNAGMSTPVLFTIAEDVRKMQLSSQVDEADIGMVKVDQASEFTVDAYSGKTFSSKVISVRNVPTVESNVVSYEVLLTVDNSDRLLKPGMTATVEIITQAMDNVLLVPNKALRFSPPENAALKERRRMPQSPLLGGGTNSSKSGRTKHTKDADDAQATLQHNEVRLWIFEKNNLKAIRVTKLATDGTNTAITGENINEGMHVVLGLVDSAIEDSDQ